MNIEQYTVKKIGSIGCQQYCGSGSGLDPDNGVLGSWFADSQSGSWSRSAKMTHKNRKKFINFIFWSTGCSLLGAEGFSCSLDVLYRGLGKSILQFWSKKDNKKISALVIEILDPDWIRIHLKCWIRIRIRIPTQWIRIHQLWFQTEKQCWLCVAERVPDEVRSADGSGECDGPSFLLYTGHGSQIHR